MRSRHAARRVTSLGRWAPVLFYSVNFLLWLVTGIGAGAFSRLWLGILPLPALVLYLLRTRRAPS